FLWPHACARDILFSCQTAFITSRLHGTTLIKMQIYNVAIDQPIQTSTVPAPLSHQPPQSSKTVLGSGPWRTVCGHGRPHTSATDGRLRVRQGPLPSAVQRTAPRTRTPAQPPSPQTYPPSRQNAQPARQTPETTNPPIGGFAVQPGPALQLRTRLNDSFSHLELLEVLDEQTSQIPRCGIVGSLIRPGVERVEQLG